MFSRLKKITKSILELMKRMRFDHVNEFSAQASFFLILSIFPFIMLLLMVIHSTPLEKTMLLSAITEIAPNALHPLITSMIDEMYVRTTGTVVSATAIAAIWTCSIGVRSITRGLHVVFHIPQKKNYFLERGISILHTIVLIFIIIISLVLVVFGNALLHLLHENLPFVYGVVKIFVDQRFLLLLLTFALFFCLLYKTITGKRYTVGQLLPGSIFSSFGWLAFSYAYSYYINNFSNYTYLYGSLTTIVILMLWVYFCMYILFLGGEINKHYAIPIQNFCKKLKAKLNNNKNKV